MGLDREFSYLRLKAAMHAILRGAKYYATNDDITLPAAGELWPGAGTMVAAINAAVGRFPEKIFGKPSPVAINLILETYNVSPTEVLIVGDRFETDIASGNAAHTDTLLVLTGIATRAEVPKQSEAMSPTFVLDSAADILDR
ncbi:MAG: HAD-superfamily hydrolase [Promethearchaeota archaeon CR_4]|nr:MAG: HAD-superfamily hydrolase [Candidatus Lokiarchaeota archaeon CR_4]